MQTKINRIGETNINYQGYKMKIIEYTDANHIIVQFDDNYNTQLQTSWRHFKNRTIKNPNVPTINNVGIVGIGAPTSINGKKIKEFETWLGIIRRCYKTCYENKEYNRNKTYYDCSVSEEWKYYPNFYNWIINIHNIYNIIIYIKCIIICIWYTINYHIISSFIFGLQVYIT